DPGPVLANFGVDHLRFLTPVKAGDTIRVLLTVKQVTPRSNADYGEVRWDAVVLNQADEPVATYDVLTLVAKTSE
ncbi:MAG TPA: phenylacetic acid degradation bifunctional protein PaaZ, partial [Nocardioides sp.]|nr:phenylacetic acid degradation bifunctional protein PaaZ [Nocardioides sp.]